MLQRDTGPQLKNTQDPDLQEEIGFNQVSKSKLFNNYSSMVILDFEDDQDKYDQQEEEDKEEDKQEDLEEEKYPSEQPAISSTASMKSLFPRKKWINPKEMLYPVRDEDSKDDYVNKRTYRDAFTKTHKAIQDMTMD